jgi:hypothetical protein
VADFRDARGGLLPGPVMVIRQPLVFGVPPRQTQRARPVSSDIDEDLQIPAGEIRKIVKIHKINLTHKV